MTEGRQLCVICDLGVCSASCGDEDSFVCVILIFVGRYEYDHGTRQGDPEVGDISRQKSVLLWRSIYDGSKRGCIPANGFFDHRNLNNFFYF